MSYIEKISAVNEQELSENSEKPVMKLVGLDVLGNFQKHTAKIIVQYIDTTFVQVIIPDKSNTNLLLTSS